MRILVLGLLMFFGCAVCQADEQYLYWGIGLEQDDGSIPQVTLAGSALDTGTYRAYIRQYAQPEVASPAVPASLRDSSLHQRLQLFNNPGEMSSYDYIQFEVENGMAVDTTAVFAQLVQDQAVSSFAIELFYDGGSGYEWYGRAAFAYNDSMSQYFHTGAMTTANPYSVNSYEEVPEPTSGVLLLVGLAGLALRRRKVQRG